MEKLLWRPEEEGRTTKKKKNSNGVRPSLVASAQVTAASKARGRCGQRIPSSELPCSPLATGKWTGCPPNLLSQSPGHSSTALCPVGFPQFRSVLPPLLLIPGLWCPRRLLERLSCTRSKACSGPEHSRWHSQSSVPANLRHEETRAGGQVESACQTLAWPGAWERATAVVLLLKLRPPSPPA